MSRRDWFRNNIWNDEIAAEFEKRLKRSRPYNRSQYLRVQAYHLRESGCEEAAIDLFKRLVAEYPPPVKPPDQEPAKSRPRSGKRLDI